MDIPALSMAMAASQTQVDVSVALASKVKDVTEQSGADLIKMMDTAVAMEQSVTPHIGGNIDVSK